jgi:hypothetical protein
MSQYPAPPPSYQAPPKAQRSYFPGEDDHEPLLGGSSNGPGPSSGGGIYNQPSEGDLPDDFKVCHVSRFTGTYFTVAHFTFSTVSPCLRAPLRSEMRLSERCIRFFVSTILPLFDDDMSDRIHSLPNCM